MLLLDVRVGITQKYEEKLNDWYYTHIPRLMSVPGYLSGRRYVSLRGERQYVALYEIRSEECVPLLLGDDHSLRHPLTLSEWKTWDKELEPIMEYSDIGLYESTAQAIPILHADYPIVRLAFDPEETLLAQLRAMTIEAAESPEVKAIAELSASDHRLAQWLETSPRALFIFECGSERAALDIAEGRNSMGKRLKDLVTDSTTVPGSECLAYRQVARHWPWFKL